MTLISQKELYGSYANEIFAGIDAEGLLWGEEMYDTKLVLYPQELKKLKGYADFKNNLINVGIVEINPHDGSLSGTTIVRYDCKTDYMYLSEGCFNGVWKKIRDSVALGIEIQKQNGAELQISRAEDIVDLSYLQRPGSEAVLKAGKITYIPRKVSDEETVHVARKHSALDNHNNLFFYSSDSDTYHDRDCECIKTITPSHFRASEAVPEGYRACYKCRRRLFLRIVCAPNVKQMALVGELLNLAGVTDQQLQKYALEDKLKMRCDNDGELIVKGQEDTWIIKGIKKEKLSLWHNNYVVLEDSQRYITDGFHKQGLAGKRIGSLFRYITGYTYEKHLKARERAKEIDNNESKELINDTEIKTKSFLARIIKFMRRFFGKAC